MIDIRFCRTKNKWHIFCTAKHNMDQDERTFMNYAHLHIFAELASH